MITMTVSEKFYTVVRKDRRITVPKQFKPGEPVEVIIKKIIKNKKPTKSEKDDTKRNTGDNQGKTTRLRQKISTSLDEKASNLREGA